MEKVLYEEHPSMFRNQPVAFVLSCLLCLIGVGIPILIVWWLRCLGTTLTVTDEKSMLRKGILSKYTNEVMHDNVRNIQVRQSFFQRIMNVGYVGISSAGQAGMEIEVKGIPDPDEVQRLISEHRKD